VIIVAAVSGSGWEAMAAAVPIRCFTHDPSIKSSLKFLRRTPWARKKVEELYLRENQNRRWQTGSVQVGLSVCDTQQSKPSVNQKARILPRLTALIRNPPRHTY